MKMYTKPEIEISVFATEDIITASTNMVQGSNLDDTAKDGVPYSNIF